MSGNPDKASLWAEADVFAAPLTATNPATINDDFGPEWGQIGLLDGEAGIVTARSEEKGDHYAWGGILVRTARRNFKLTKKFTALEDNATTRSLIWPGSPVGQIVVPRPVPIKLGFELREGGKKKRLITARHAEVDLDGDVTENESDLTKYELLATIFPTGGGVLFIEQDADVAVATGALAGTPGSFTPAGAAVPANLAALAGVTASPSAAWDVGEYVVLGDSSSAHWTGSAWASGVAE